MSIIDSDCRITDKLNFLKIINKYLYMNKKILQVVIQKKNEKQR